MSFLVFVLIVGVIAFIALASSRRAAGSKGRGRRRNWVNQNIRTADDSGTLLVNSSSASLFSDPDTDCVDADTDGSCDFSDSGSSCGSSGSSDSGSSCGSSCGSSD